MINCIFKDYCSNQVTLNSTQLRLVGVLVIVVCCRETAYGIIGAMRELTHRVYNVFTKSANTSLRADYLYQDVAKRLLNRLGWITADLTDFLVCGASAGSIAEGCLDFSPKAKVLAYDLAEARLSQVTDLSNKSFDNVAGSYMQLPFSDNVFDCVIANLVLPWVNDYEEVFTEYRRVLRPGGVLLFSSFGPDTLRELANACAEVNDHIAVPALPDLHDIGDLLLALKFQDPVMDMEVVTTLYESADTLLQDLQDLGISRAMPRAHQGLLGSDTWQRVIDLMEARSNVDGKLSVTCELIFGLIWQHDMSRMQQSNAQGEALIPISVLKS